MFPSLRVLCVWRVSARVVYAIQSFGREPTNTATVYLDDVSFIPEPSSTVLLGLGALALAGARCRGGLAVEY